MRGIYTIFTVFGDVVCIRFPDGTSYPETGCAGFWEMGAERLRPLGRLGPGRMGHESYSYGPASECISRRFRKRKKPYISLIHKVSFFLSPFLSKASGAENGTRTRDLNLGKVALYQLSYFRMACFVLRVQR